jgi:hypothetical protein
MMTLRQATAILDRVAGEPPIQGPRRHLRRSRTNDGNPDRNHRGRHSEGQRPLPPNPVRPQVRRQHRGRNVPAPRTGAKHLRVRRVHYRTGHLRLPWMHVFRVLPTADHRTDLRGRLPSDCPRMGIYRVRFAWSASPGFDRAHLRCCHRHL